MEQRLYELDTLREELEDELTNELLSGNAVLQALADARENSTLIASNEDACRDLAARIAIGIVKEVKSQCDSETNELVTYAKARLDDPAPTRATARHAKVNARPKWAKPQRRYGSGLKNYVITSWPSFDRVLIQAARDAARDAAASITPSLTQMIGIGVTAAAGPVGGAVAVIGTAYVSNVVTETVASLATVALSMEKVDPALRCVFQRALKISRLSKFSAHGDPSQVTVEQVVTSFNNSGQSPSTECSDFYYERVGECPFAGSVMSGDEGEGRCCLLAHKEGRPRPWDDDESLDDKVKRIMFALKEQGVLINRFDRHADKFFRSKHLITGYDTLDGR